MTRNLTPLARAIVRQAPEHAALRMLDQGLHCDRVERRQVHHAEGLPREGPRGGGGGLDRGDHVQREFVLDTWRRDINVKDRALRPVGALRDKAEGRVPPREGLAR